MQHHIQRQTREISLGFSEKKHKEGHHIIYVYDSDIERKKTMAKFLQQGILDNEKVLYLVDEMTPDEMRAEFRTMGIDTEKKQNNFDIAGSHYTLCPNQFFCRDFMLDLVGNYYDNAVNTGYAGARGAGEMTWALLEDKANISDLLDYEASLNEILHDHPLTTVCLYDARRFSESLIRDLISIHPMMIIGNKLVKNKNYIEKETFLKKYKERTSGNSHNQKNRC